MNQSNLKQNSLIKRKLEPKLLLSLITTISVFLYPLILPARSNAEAKIVGISRDGALEYMKGSRTNTKKKITGANKNQIPLFQSEDRLLIPTGQNASLNINYSTSTTLGRASVNFDMTVAGKGAPAEYSFVCKGSGNFALGWFNSSKGFTQTPCKVFKLKNSSLVKASSPSPPIPVLLASKKLVNLRIASTEAFDRVFYCSSMSKTSTGWGFNASNYSWDLLSPNDPCAKAFAECKQTPGSTCSTVGVGEWSFREENLIASLQCDGISPGDPRYTLRSIRGSDLIQRLETLKTNAKAAGTGSCLISVTAPDELNISPKGGNLDLATVYDFENKLIVIGLSGKVLVSSTQLPQGVTVSAGEVYIYDTRQPSLSNGSATQLATCPADAYRFFIATADSSSTQQPPPSDYKGKQLSEPSAGVSAQQLLAQTSNYGENQTSPNPLLPLLQQIVPRLIQRQTAPGSESPQQPFTVTPGGVVCGIPPELRQKTVKNSPAIAAFQGETNWGDPTLASNYKAAIQREFLTVSARTRY